MAEPFFVVFNQTRPSKSGPELKGKGVQEKHGKTEYETLPEEARFLKIEAESVKEAQNAIRHWIPGDCQATPAVVKSTGWLESEAGGGSENYIVVFGQTALPDDKFAYEKKFEKAEVLGEFSECNIIEIKAETVKEARIAITRHFSTNIMTVPIVVKEPEFKTS